MFNLSEISNIIRQSHLRCENEYKIPKGRVFPLKIVKGLEFQRLCKKNYEVIKVARPFMEILYDFLRGSGFFLDLTDKDGVILIAIGDRDVIEEAKKMKMIEGSDMSEKSTGFKDGVFAEYFHVNDAAKFYGINDIVNYKNGDIVKQIFELTDGKGVDHVIMAGGGTDTLAQAIKILKPGGVVSNVNYHGSGNLEIPREEWGCGVAHKTIKGGLCPGGRLRMERLIDLVKYNRLDPAKLVTHVYHGFDHIEESLLLMKNKPRDLIKPVVVID